MIRFGNELRPQSLEAEASQIRAQTRRLLFIALVTVLRERVCNPFAGLRLPGLARGLARSRPPSGALGAAQLDSGEFEKLVNRSEAILIGELTGWVQQMSDTMQELKNRQAGTADQIDREGGRAVWASTHCVT